MHCRRNRQKTPRSIQIECALSRLPQNCRGAGRSHRRLRRDRLAAGFLRAAAALLIANSSSFLPRLSSAVSHRGRAPRPAQVSPSGLRYFGATFLPLREDRPILGVFLPMNESSLSSLEWSSRLAATTLVDKIRSRSSRKSIKASSVMALRFTPFILLSFEADGVVVAARREDDKQP